VNALIGRFALLATTWSAIFTASLDAHEFIVKPAQLQVESGAKLPFSILSTHVFMVSEEVEPLETVKGWFVQGDKSMPLKLKENHMLDTIDGVVTPLQKGSAFLVGELREPIGTIKSESSGRSQRIKREKFTKALLTVTNGDENYKRALGHKLEIVPVTAITGAKAGDDLTFRIFLDGKPLKGQVYATYDGFSRRPMTFAYATETREDGVALVKVTNPGVWMVRVEKRLETNQKDYDILSLKATFVFSVQ
jgi:nickel transport protein